jgi:hypothetical protein
MTFAHLVEAIDGVLRRLGGMWRAGRTDRMATVVDPESDLVTESSRRSPSTTASRRGSVRRGGRSARASSRRHQVRHAFVVVHRPVASLGQAQPDLDCWALAMSDRRRRRGTTISELSAHERLRVLPAAAFPAQLELDRVMSRTATVAFEGNRYSAAPGHIGQTVTVRARLGELQLEFVSAATRRIARRRGAPAGAGQTVHSADHAGLLERAVLEAFTTERPCRRKANRPPGPAALAEAAAARPRPRRRSTSTPP